MTPTPTDAPSHATEPAPPPVYPARLRYGVRYVGRGRARVVGRTGSVEVEVVPCGEYSDVLRAYYALTGRAGR